VLLFCIRIDECVMNKIQKQILKIFCFLVIVAMTHEYVLASGTSNYLFYPHDNNNYPISDVTNWSLSHPTIGAPVLAPAAYGSSAIRRADHAQLTGDYNNHNSLNSLVVYSRFTPVNVTNEFMLVHGDNSTSAWVFRVSSNEVATGVSGPPLRMKPSLGS